MVKVDILVIGGGPAGVVAAVNARKNNRSKKIVLARENKEVVIPCGIPYIFNRLSSVGKNLMSDGSLKLNKITLLVGKAIRISTSKKTVFFSGGKKVSYDKLILATGSGPALVPIKGIEKKGVWQIRKDFAYLKKLRRAVMNSKNVVVIGGGFIGVELAEELSGIKGLKVSVVERLGHCLITTFDEDIAVLAEKRLEQGGARIYTNAQVDEISGRNCVERVKLSTGKSIRADLVILSIGARINAGLAERAGIRIGDYNGIWVDEYMRTSVPDIFAVGDCAETRDFFTGKHIPVMLASTAATEARIAGANLYQLRILRENKGTLGSFSTYIKGTVFGVTGLTESRARAEGADIVVGTSKCLNHHPGSLPGAEAIMVKLVFSKQSGTLMGAQIMGPVSVSEMINTLALAIQREMTVYDFDTLQISTHPLLTAAPTVYPLITAAQSALSKIQ